MDKDYTRKKIAQIMNEKGIMQKDLAAGVGVSPFVVSHWLNGLSTSYMTRLDKIAKYLHVSMDYLTGNSASVNSGEVQKYLDELKNRSEMRMLFKAAKGATRDDIEKAAKIIEVLKEKSK